MANNPTSHDIARELLQLPELPLIIEDDMMKYQIIKIILDNDSSWDNGEKQIEDKPAILLRSCVYGEKP